MSFILDSLRKSEQERQLAAGQVVSMSYPIQNTQKRKSLLIPIFLLLFTTVGTLFIIWKITVQDETSATHPIPTVTSQVTQISIPPSITEAKSPESLTEQKLPGLELAFESKAAPVTESTPPVTESTPPVTESTPPVTKPKPKSVLPSAQVKSSRKQTTKPATQPEATPSPAPELNRPAPADPLSDLPELKISGYIHNEQGGSLALINDRLVSEGEEVSPGLRLLSIHGNSVTFNYKGYEFTRKQ